MLCGVHVCGSGIGHNATVINTVSKPTIAGTQPRKGAKSGTSSDPFRRASLAAIRRAPHLVEEVPEVLAQEGIL